MIGESSVGKTSLVLRFDNRGFNQKFTTTIGVDYSDRVISIDGKDVKLQIWDTAGQERFHSLTTSFFKRAEGFALVFDLNKRDTFDSIARWMKDVQAQAKPDSDIVLVGNKCDVIERVVTKEEAEELAVQYGIPYFETSAKENINVEDMFTSLATSIKKRIVEDEPEEEKTIDLNKPNDEPKAGCC